MLKKLEVIGFLIGIFALVTFITISFTRNNTLDSEYDTRSDKIKAWALAKYQIEQNLLSPSTADYESYNEENVIYQYNKGTYLVTMYVDAENVFGAKIRKNFTVETNIK